MSNRNLGFRGKYQNRPTNINLEKSPGHHHITYTNYGVHHNMWCATLLETRNAKARLPYTNHTITSGGNHKPWCALW